MAQRVVRIDLGCGDHKKDGYLGLDNRRDSSADVLADVRALPFRNLTVDEINASHILEHFPRSTTSAVLREWHRVLKPGGSIQLFAPRLEHYALLTLFAALLGATIDHILPYLYGTQDYQGNYHFTGFTAGSLKSTLELAGFSQVRVRRGRQPQGVESRIGRAVEAVVSHELSADATKTVQLVDGQRGDEARR